MKTRYRRLARGPVYATGVESSFMLTSPDEKPAGTPETNWKIAFPLKCVPFRLAPTHKAQRGFGTLEDLNHSVCEFLPSTQGRPIAFDINANIAIAEAKDTVIRQFKVSRTAMLLDRIWFSFPFDGGLECAMSEADLETRILKRLQEHSQTMPQLKASLKESRESILLMALHNLRKSG